MWSKINNLIDNFLNQTTMYRLVLYVLIGFFIIAVYLAGFSLLPFSPVALLLSVGFLLLISKVSNGVFSKVFEAPTNVESVYITALILGMIITPVISISGLAFLFWAAVLATASKYILTINNKHLFNPVAVAVVLTVMGFNASASWWIGNSYMALPTAIGSYLIIRKIRRQDQVYSFLFTVILLTLGFGIIQGSNLNRSFNTLIFHSSLLFFAGVMLTEPLTSPHTKNLQFIFGTLVGFLFVPQVHIGNIFFTPEQALVIGNIFAYIVSPKQKLILKVKQKIKISPNVIDFIFSTNYKVSFNPGQYMEWTLSHSGADSRGNRRYFTLASSPTEKDLRISIKFPLNFSSYKKAMQEMENPTIVASQLAGDFTLPKNPLTKLAFIAGGIGITPFRSMIKYLIDKNERRDIVLLYTNRNAGDIVYRDVFDQAAKQLGIKVIYHLTGISGHFDEKNLPMMIPDYNERLFYISGTHQMVTSTEELLRQIGVKHNKIKTDFFPGFA